jgi:hypothetical protein
MPFKSNKQRRYMNWAASKGKIDQKVVDEFNDASKGLELPEKANKYKKISKYFKNKGK